MTRTGGYIFCLPTARDLNVLFFLCQIRMCLSCLVRTGLKYKLACGSLVFKFESTFKEFYEPALKDGVHVVKLKEDPAVFEAETGEPGLNRVYTIGIVAGKPRWHGA